MTGDRVDTPAALGVLLAGGQNRRYGGRPKALARVGGEPIASRAIGALREAVSQVVMVANEPDPYAELGLTIRPDLRPGVGALGGIHTAVVWAAESGASGALVAACDMPFLSAPLLRRLLVLGRADRVVAPASGSRRGLEPLCAFYGTDCFEAIEAAIDRGERSIVSFFPDVEVVTLPPADVASFGDPALLFLNVNAPEDRERAEAAARALERDET